jgi:pimeloyl-ACP methyl ester carboxylesterase
MFVTVDGQDVHASTGGRTLNPALKTVIFLHGTGQDHSIWVLPTRYFARHDRNVLALDLPGHGQSGGTPLETVESMADWVVEVMDAVAIDEAAIVGHSLGSLIAISAASRYPDRVRAIALIGTTVPMRVSPRLLEQARDNRQEAIEMLNYWGYSRSAQLGGSDTPGNWMLAGGMRLMERAAPGVIYADLKACDDYAQGLEEAARVACPALLILGERDRLTPSRSAGALASALPHSETVVLEGSGHALLAEKPEHVLDQLIRIG